MGFQVWLGVVSNVQSLRIEFNRAVEEESPECQNDPNMFDPDYYPSTKSPSSYTYPDLEFRAYAIAAAKAVCAECPLVDLCLQVALTYREPAMIWGGLTPDEREKLLSK